MLVAVEEEAARAGLADGRGGPVIELRQECGYEQGTIALEAGDLLVAFTDGISEAMNTADQEWCC